MANMMATAAETPKEISLKFYLATLCRKTYLKKLQIFQKFSRAFNII